MAFYVEYWSKLDIFRMGWGADSFILGKRRYRRLRNFKKQYRFQHHPTDYHDLRVYHVLCRTVGPNVSQDDQDLDMSADNEGTSELHILHPTNADIKGTSALTESEHGKDDDVTLDDYTEYYKTLLRCIMMNAANHIRLVCIVM